MQKGDENAIDIAVDQLKNITSTLFNQMLDILEGGKRAEDEKEKKEVKEALKHFKYSNWQR